MLVLIEVPRKFSGRSYKRDYIKLEGTQKLL